MTSKLDQLDADADADTTAVMRPETLSEIVVPNDQHVHNLQDEQQQQSSQPINPSQNSNINNDAQKSPDIVILPENEILVKNVQETQVNTIPMGLQAQQPKQPDESEESLTDPELIKAYYLMVSEIKEMDDKKKFVDRESIITLKNVDIQKEKYELQCDPMENILQKCIAIQLQSNLKCKATDSALTELTNLTVEYMGILFTNLRKLTEIQRRRIPGRRDLTLLAKEGYFNWSDIESAIEDDKKLSKKNISKLTKLNKEAEKMINAMDNQIDGYGEIEESNPSYVFLNDITSIISEVVPPSKSSMHNKQYIPHWMPPLPPDHTYKSTPRYTKRITEPRRLREALVKEGRLGETALHNIIDKKTGVLGLVSEVEVSDPEVDDFSDSGSDSDIEGAKNLENDSNKKEDTLETSPDNKVDSIQSGATESSKQKVSILLRTPSGTPSVPTVVSSLSDVSTSSSTEPVVVVKQEFINITSVSPQGTPGSQPPIKQEPHPISTSTSKDTISNFLIDKLPQTSQVKLEEKDSPANINPTLDINEVSDNNVSLPEQTKSFDIVAFAKKRMERLEKRKADKLKQVKERLNSEEAKLGKNLGFYTSNTHLPENYNETLNSYYNDKFNIIRRNLVIQQKRRSKYLKKQESKRRRREKKEKKKNEAITEFTLDFVDEQNDVDMDEFQFNDEEDQDPIAG